MTVAGIDYSTRSVDIVLLEEDTDAATWHRYELDGQDAFERARSVRGSVPGRTSGFWDDVLAVGIEDPRGYGAGSLYRVQGAILSCFPALLLVQPLIPSQWRKQVGLPGNAPKMHVAAKTAIMRGLSARAGTLFPEPWPQDACDAYCVALATRTLMIASER